MINTNATITMLNQYRRERFVYEFLFDGLDLNGKDVVDVAAGSGHNSLWVCSRFPEARLCGIDVSDKACAAYRELVGHEAHVFDLTSGQSFGRQFDVTMVFGGLHHCVSDLPGTLRTLAQLVRPGGLLLMFEPNRRYLLEGLRRLWYRWDSTFEAETEGALDHHALSVLAAPFRTDQLAAHGRSCLFFDLQQHDLSPPATIKTHLCLNSVPD